MTVVTVAELLDWIAGAWVPNAIADIDDQAAPSDYNLAAEPHAAHQRHTELLDRVTEANVDPPAVHDPDAYRALLEDLAWHRWSMRTRAAALARSELLERSGGHDSSYPTPRITGHTSIRRGRGVRRRSTATCVRSSTCSPRSRPPWPGRSRSPA